MKIDPLDVATDALTTLPGRLFAAWLAVVSGVVLPLFIVMLLSGEWLVPGEKTGWMILFFAPFVSAFGGMVHEWWALISLPLSIVVTFRAVMFVASERSHTDLFILFGLSFLATGWVFWYAPVVGVFLLSAICYGLYRARQYRKATEW